MSWLALDIGGANLKVADGCGYANSRPLALWKHRERLASELRDALAAAPPHDSLAVTMTGELADCFVDRTEGVRWILQAVEQAADGRHTRVYLVDGSLVAPSVAAARPLAAASANWHALARFCGRFIPQGPGLMIDVGSTTVDLIPLFEGQPATSGQTDLERLLAGQLVYTGVERSSVCAVVQHLPYRGRDCPAAQEHFATMRDVYLLLGDVPDQPDDDQTADGRPATRRWARVRMARMLTADPPQFQLSDALACARHVADAQLALLVRALEQVVQAMPTPPTAAVLAGHGDYLARRLVAALPTPPETVSLADQLGRDVARCAPAHALAVLARETAPGALPP